MLSYAIKYVIICYYMYMLLYVIVCYYMLLYVIGLDNILRFQTGTLLVDLLNDMCKDGHGYGHGGTTFRRHL